MKEDEEYGEMCVETKCEMKEENENAKDASVNEVTESTAHLNQPSTDTRLVRRKSSI